MVNISTNLCSAANISSPNLWNGETGAGFFSACFNSPTASITHSISDVASIDMSCEKYSTVSATL